MNKFFVYCDVSFDEKELTKVLNLLLQNDLTYISLKKDGCGKAILSIIPSMKNKYESLLIKYSIEFTFSKNRGIFSFFLLEKLRIGIIIGIFFMIIISYYSSKVVWKVSINGNTSVEDDEIIAELDSIGFGVGSFIPTINYDQLHNSFLMISEKISWISINITGNVANVEVRESRTFDTENYYQYSNIVAKFDGQIAQISVIEGEKVISIGDVVRKGDLLISGLVESQSEGIRYLDAEGEVLAYTNKQIEIFVPYNSRQKVYTGKIYYENRYKIFNNIIKFSSKYRNYSTLCDKIEKREKISILGNSSLPFEKITDKYYEYEFQNVEYTRSEAVDLAFKELRAQLDFNLKNAELVSKTTNTSYDERGFYIYCNLYCLENIAIDSEFYIEK